MLKTLDILIGVATVMLLFSMVVTIVTQSIISGFQTRGRNLRNGLAGLLKQLDPEMEEKIATQVSNALLRHPLIGGKLGALGTVIHRDEFTTLLMEVAAGQSTANVAADAKAAVVKLLQKNGVGDPAAALKNIRDVALQLEAASPELANDVRASMAILQEAKSEYVAKIHGWFDQTMDRVSQRFTANAHAITFVVALIVAFSVQLDTIALVNRLSTDDAMRTYLVGRAQQISQEAAQKGLVNDKSVTPAPAPSPTPTPAPNAQKEITDVLQKNGLIVAPQWQWPFSHNQQGELQFNWNLESKQLVGILLSTLLLTLGAPFWYGALQSLLKLRSDVAQKDDLQRSSRQGAQDASAAAAADGAALPASFKGEQGNLQAVG